MLPLPSFGKGENPHDLGDVYMRVTTHMFYAVLRSLFENTERCCSVPDTLSRALFSLSKILSRGRGIVVCEFNMRHAFHFITRATIFLCVSMSKVKLQNLKANQRNYRLGTNNERLKKPPFLFLPQEVDLSNIREESIHDSKIQSS